MQADAPFSLMHALKVRIAAFVSFTVIAADLVPSVRRATEEIFIDLVALAVSRRFPDRNHREFELWARERRVRFANHV